MDISLARGVCILVEHNSDKVEVSGVPCLGLCSIDWEFSKAPYVKVDEDVIKEATVEKVLKAIDAKLNK